MELTNNVVSSGTDKHPMRNCINPFVFPIRRVVSEKNDLHEFNIQNVPVQLVIYNPTTDRIRARHAN